MHKIYFYKNKKGEIPALSYIKNLSNLKSKKDQILLDKINDYIQALAEYGLQLGMPYLKHIDKNLWELRPKNKRFFFVTWINGSFIILHQFTKKTRKTPPVEIERARKEIKEIEDDPTKYKA